jgi:thiol-disulfide isomerase/thioredoxin
MVRWVFGIGAAVLVGYLVLRFGGFLEPEDRDKAIHLLSDDFSKAFAEAKQAYESARSPQDQEAAKARIPDVKNYVSKALQIAGPNPTDHVGLECLEFSFGISNGQDQKVVDLLISNYAKNPDIKRICLMVLAYGGSDEASRLLKEVLEKNTDPEAAGYACFALARLATAANSDDPTASKEAEAYYERIARDYANVKLPNGEAMKERVDSALFAFRNLRVGATAPNVESQNLKGEKVQLKDYRGKVVVLDIWATWCGPCKAMIPHERDMVQRLKDKPFALIAVSADDHREDVTHFLEKEPMPWTHWWEGKDGKMIREWQVAGFPTLYVLDANGVIRFKFMGAKTDALEKAVQSLLAEMK